MGVRVRLPPAAPKQKVIRKDDLLFWVPAAEGRLHPTVIEMLGRSEFALRRGFASGKTLVRRKGAAGQKAGCSGCIQSFRNFKISILTTLPSSSRAYSAAPRFQIEPAALGFDLVLGANLSAMASILL